MSDTVMAWLTVLAALGAAALAIAAIPSMKDFVKPLIGLSLAILASAVVILVIVSTSDGNTPNAPASPQTSTQSAPSTEAVPPTPLQVGIAPIGGYKLADGRYRFDTDQAGNGVFRMRLTFPGDVDTDSCTAKIEVLRIGGGRATSDVGTCTELFKFPLQYGSYEVVVQVDSLIPKAHGAATLRFDIETN